MRLLLFLALQTVGIHAEIDRQDGAINIFNVVNQGRMGFVHVLMYLEDISLYECTNYCIMHLRCQSVSYSSFSKLCELNDIEFDEFEAETGPFGWLNYGTPPKIDGGYSDWTNITGCSSACGEGQMTYYRSCDNPKPQQGGLNCVGEEIKVEPCFIRICPVCYGARLNEYGNFTVPKSGSTKEIHLTHISGSLKCNHVHPKSNWGCSYYIVAKNDKDAFETFVTDENREVLFPQTSKERYSLDGKSIYEDEITLRRTASINITAGQTLRIYYGQDLYKTTYENNSGEHCAYVEIIYD